MNEWLRRVIERRIVGVTLKKKNLVELVEAGWKVKIWAGYERGLVEVDVDKLPDDAECELHEVDYMEQYVEIRDLRVPVKVPIKI